MNVQIFRDRAMIQKGLLDRRFENQIERRFARYAGEENTKTADVLTRCFVASSGDLDGSSKECNPRQNGPFEQRARHEIKPEFMSLADIYEGALRKVLNLQLNLKIEEHPRFHDLNHDVTYREKSSPPRPRAIRIEDAKQREEFRHQRRANEDENDPRVTPQGHNVLRKVGERSQAEGSAFHVPSKRRYDGHSFTSVERESDLPGDRFGVPRHVGPDYPGEYGPSHYRPRLYGPRMDQIGRPTLGPSFMDPRSVVHETYSRYSSHHREIPPLFPVHCATSERNGPTKVLSTEHERRERRCPDVPSINSLHDLKYNNSKMPIAKFEQEEKENLEETFNKASKCLSIHSSTSPSSPDHKSPRTDRAQPYGRHTGPNSNPTTNGFEDNDKTDKEKKQLSGEEGEKEEFLSNLGLARIF